MRCANSEALGRYMSGLDAYEQASIEFVDYFEDELQQISDLVDTIYKAAADWNGYDLTEDAKIAINDVV